MKFILYLISFILIMLALFIIYIGWYILLVLWYFHYNPPVSKSIDYEYNPEDWRFSNEFELMFSFIIFTTSGNWVVTSSNLLVYSRISSLFLCSCFCTSFGINTNKNK